MPHPVRKKAIGTYGNHSLTKVKGWRSAQGEAGAPARKGRALLPALDHVVGLAPDQASSTATISKRLRIDHHDLVADQDELIAAPFRIDRHDFRRKRMEGDVARHAGADRDREVDVGRPARTCCSRITVVILVRCSVESLAPAPACPTVLRLGCRPALGLGVHRSGRYAGLRPSCRCARRGLRPSCPCPILALRRSPAHARRAFVLGFLLLGRPCMFSVGALVLGRAGRISARTGSTSCPAAPASRLIWLAAVAAALGRRRALLRAEPADGASRLMPVPCALAKPVPAISASAATEIIND